MNHLCFRKSSCSSLHLRPSKKTGSKIARLILLHNTMQRLPNHRVQIAGGCKNFHRVQIVGGYTNFHRVQIVGGYTNFHRVQIVGRSTLSFIRDTDP